MKLDQRVNVTSALHGHALSLGFQSKHTSDEWHIDVSDFAEDEIEDTEPWDLRANTALVSWLLSQAASINLASEPDQLYMPMPRTILVEALQYLGTNGRVGVYKAIITWHEHEQRFTVQALGTHTEQTINRLEVMELLRACYPLR
jgi:hypothetical protein